VALVLLHPQVAARSCTDCVRWLHDDAGDEFGPVTRRPARTGSPVPRPAGMPTPCHRCPKTEGEPVRTREHARELTPALRACYMHYLECRAVGRFPDDDLVRRHARIIRSVEDEVGALRLERIEAYLKAMIGARK
jgi:hypothetical protein